MTHSNITQPGQGSRGPLVQPQRLVQVRAEKSLRDRTLPTVDRWPGWTGPPAHMSAPARTRAHAAQGRARSRAWSTSIFFCHGREEEGRGAR